MEPGQDNSGVVHFLVLQVVAARVEAFSRNCAKLQFE